MARKLTTGRLLCDTELGAREPLRETSYDLPHLVAVRLKETCARRRPLPLGEERQ